MCGAFAIRGSAVKTDAEDNVLVEVMYTYDVFGNQTSVATSGADILSRTSRATYDARGRFIASSANAHSRYHG